jgi:hypothetical protein
LNTTNSSLKSVATNDEPPMKCSQPIALIINVIPDKTRRRVVPPTSVVMISKSNTKSRDIFHGSSVV